MKARSNNMKSTVVRALFIVPGIWFVVSFANQIVIQSWAMPIAQREACGFLASNNTLCTSSSDLIRAEMQHACTSMTTLCKGNVALLITKVAISEIGNDVQQAISHTSFTLVIGICGAGLLLWLVFVFLTRLKVTSKQLSGIMLQPTENQDAECGTFQMCQERKTV